MRKEKRKGGKENKGRKKYRMKRFPNFITRSISKFDSPSTSTRLETNISFQNPSLIYKKFTRYQLFNPGVHKNSVKDF